MACCFLIPVINQHHDFVLDQCFCHPNEKVSGCSKHLGGINGCSSRTRRSLNDRLRDSSFWFFVWVTEIKKSKQQNKLYIYWRLEKLVWYTYVESIVTQISSTQSTQSSRCSTGTKPYVIKWANGQSFHPACIKKKTKVCLFLNLKTYTI